MKKSVFIGALSLALPLTAAAQVSNLEDVFQFINNLINTLLPLIIAAAVVYFIYGIARYVMAGDEDAKSAAKDKIIYGVIGLFVMVSVWGLVNILTNTFFGGTVQGVPSGVDTQIPDIIVDL